jgi:hypothetical protein
MLQIVLRLPDGSRVQRRFACDAATVADLYDWAEAQGVAAPTFRRVLCEGALCLPATFLHVLTLGPCLSRASLVTALPRTVYTRDLHTLQAVGLQSQTVLLVEASE